MRIYSGTGKTPCLASSGATIAQPRRSPCCQEPQKAAKAAVSSAAAFCGTSTIGSADGVSSVISIALMPGVRIFDQGSSRRILVDFLDTRDRHHAPMGSDDVYPGRNMVSAAITLEGGSVGAERGGRDDARQAV